jgi:hypothetical protein
MQLHFMTEVEIDSLQSHQRPEADMHYTDSSDRAMTYGSGLDPSTHFLL